MEAFTCLLIFKNIFSFVLTFFAYEWLVQRGIKPAFMAISSIQVVICLLSVPMCKDFCPDVPGAPRLLTILRCFR